jgi:hypothetical protein
VRQKIAAAPLFVCRHACLIAIVPRGCHQPGLVADGKRLLITRRDPSTGTRDIWINDLFRGTLTRLTFDPAEDFNPAWSPDGTVAFSSSRRGHRISIANAPTEVAPRRNYWPPTSTVSGFYLNHEIPFRPGLPDSDPEPPSLQR